MKYLLLLCTITVLYSSAQCPDFLTKYGITSSADKRPTFSTVDLGIPMTLPASSVQWTWGRNKGSAIWPRVERDTFKLPDTYAIKQEVTCYQGTWTLTTYGIEKKKGTCCPVYEHSVMSTLKGIKAIKVVEYRVALDALKNIIELSYDGWSDTQARRQFLDTSYYSKDTLQ